MHVVKEKIINLIACEEEAVLPHLLDEMKSEVLSHHGNPSIYLSLQEKLVCNSFVHNSSDLGFLRVHRVFPSPPPH